ncbi:sulfurtransferase TusA family protein [Arenimonas daejeonensis]|uniref:sulfurtransferase TusA family protein n=1 Tax=Arenimonas daejeonensis TaxID=370777 RepID=UPI0011BDAA50|nr:sulfurtransferase TusA family protein [Arenimonas daejeonensis]
MHNDVPPTLDFRDLPAPEPLVRALHAIDTLAPGGMVRVLTPMHPQPLLDLLRSRRLGFSTMNCEGGGCAVTVWSEDGAAGA